MSTITAPHADHTRQPHRVSHFRLLTAAGLVAAAGIAAGALYRSLEYATPVNAFTYQAAPDNLQIASILHRVGLDSSILTAAGLSANAVTTLVDNARAHLDENHAGLVNVDTAFNEARAERDRLERLIQSGMGTENDVTAFATATGAFATAQANRQTALNNLVAAATTGLSSETKTQLALLRANSGWEGSVAYHMIERTEAQWVQLRDALAHERIALSHDEPVDSAVQSFLADVRTNLAVSTALTNLEANLATINTAWNTAVYEGD